MNEHTETEPLFLDSDTVVEPSKGAQRAHELLDLPTVEDGAPFDAPDLTTVDMHGAPQPKSSKSADEIKLLVQHGLDIVHTMARKVARQVGRVTDVDELVSVGQSALFDAARSHDAALAPFVPYASNRVRWAMIDSIRRQTHNRAAAARARAITALDGLGEVAASPENEALQNEITYQARLKTTLATEAAAMFIGLTCGGDESATSQPDDGPDEALMRRRAGKAVRDALADLPERERVIVERHYFGGERFDRIAEDLGLSKSWLSRLHAQAISKLGDKLRDH